MKQTILVTGGTGFIGSHTTVELQQAGYKVVIVDNLSNSKKEVVDGIEKITGVIKKYDIPIRPSEWNITKEIFINAWIQAPATRSDRYTILNETDLSPERLGRIYDDMEDKF